MPESPERAEVEAGRRDVLLGRHAVVPEFRRNELYETLLRIKHDQPRRYRREVSEGMQRRVEGYEHERAELGRRAEGLTGAAPGQITPAAIVTTFC